MGGYEEPAARRPYAATANVLAVLERVRNRNMPARINADFLRIAGIGEAVVGRVTEALLFLGLIEVDGSPTEDLHAMAGAPDPAYRELLAERVRGAYASDLATINPGEDSQQQIVEAFRRYEPKSQIPRMVMLLLGLCREAGIAVRDAPRERGMQGAPRRPVRGPTPPVLRARRKPRVEVRADGGGPRILDVTEADLGKLSQEEFDEVWGALGKVAYTLSRARVRPSAEAAGKSVGSEGEEVAPE
jgi:hypothetical protein